jgi:uncharacterized protein YyaL (SSP411 family)
MPNRLINETSPYLLQHAHNPVDWYPWGPEALEKAHNHNKPIFLSIGYAACHWCHVMEKESFENEAIAAIMNEHFINIKVDREERPDLDSIYMEAVVAMTGQGGWPMSVWLTPEGVPFYGGTYFPPTDRMGMPSFPRVLESLAHTYQRQNSQIYEQGAQLLSRMAMSLPLNGSQNLNPATPTAAIDNLLRHIDYTHGGTSGAPKFPQPMIYDFLLHAYYRTKNEKYLNVVELTLQKMAEGGIYDQLGGGFHRYSTDALWLAPHFEKMLYDNALLARLYLHAYQITAKPLYKRIVEETLDYVIREMTDDSGGFYATQDADSEGEEGKFFVWRPTQIKKILGETAGDHFCRVYDVTTMGNWEGHSILRRTRPLADIAAEVGLSLEALQSELTASRAKLFAHRETRIKPARDEKIITAWNGIMLAAFAEAGRVLQRDDYLAVAEKNARFIKSTLLHQENRLYRTWKDGQAKLMGYLEDYAFTAQGLLTLYQANFDETWFSLAQNLMTTLLTHFTDHEHGGFYDTATDHESLVVRPKTLQDNAIPCGNSMAVRVLLDLAAYTGDNRYHSPALTALSALQDVLTQYPLGFGYWLGNLELALAERKEIALIGPPHAPDTQTLRAAVQGHYAPHYVIGLTPSQTETSAIPLLNHRPQVDGRPTAYVCQNFACQLPVNTVEQLKEQLS